MDSRTSLIAVCASRFFGNFRARCGNHRRQRTLIELTSTTW